jgi:uncharacterized protein
MPPQAKSKGRGKGTRQVKIVVTGPFAVGKTTLIKTMSEIAVLSTERKVSDNGAQVKANTTVAMDFGRLTIDSDLQLYLFGTPGQKRFDFMWEVLAEGMLGFVVLVDAQREASYEEAEEILEFFHESAAVPYVVAVNKGDDEHDGGVEQARSWLRLPEHIRCVPVDARDKESVKGVLLELLYAVLDEIEEAQEPAAV